MTPRNQDVKIGNAVLLLRGDRSQQSVAAAMRERGWKWSQSTVWSVETGERPLRLSEAEDLASVLGASTFDLLREPAETQIFVAMGRAAETYRAIEDATAAFFKAQLELASTLMDKAENGEALSDLVADGGGWTAVTPEMAVADARRHLGQNSDDEHDEPETHDGPAEREMEIRSASPQKPTVVLVLGRDTRPRVVDDE